MHRVHPKTSFCFLASFDTPLRGYSGMRRWVPCPRVAAPGRVSRGRTDQNREAILGRIHRILTTVFLAFLLAYSPLAEAQKLVSGTVTDADTSEPLPGATIRIEDTRVGAMADSLGGYVLDLWQLPQVVHVSCVGYHSQRVIVSEGSGTKQNISLARASLELEELVVTAKHPYLTRFTVYGGWDGAWSPDGKRIAFTSTRSGNADIWVQATGSGEAVQYTTDPAWDSSPAWSPDGLLLAFTSERSGALNIWLMPASGGDKRQVTSDDDRLYDGRFSKASRGALFSWSPDGKEIAFARRAGRNQQLGLGQRLKWKHGIWRIPVGGGEARQVTDEGGHHANPMWSPDGRQITLTDRGEIFTVRLSNEGTADGGKKRLLKWPGTEYAYSWSPDGGWLAFASDKLDGDTYDVWVMPSKGGKAVRITNTPTRTEGQPRWSPDGRRLVFQSRPAGYDLWVTPSAGGEAVKIAEGVEAADWSPDGAEIAMIAYTDVGKDIFGMPVSGGRWIPVTTGGVILSYGSGLSWSPDGTLFAVISHRGTLDKRWRKGLDLWTVATTGKRKRKVLTNYPGGGWHTVYRPCWSPDSKEIAFTRLRSISIISVPDREIRSRFYKMDSGTYGLDDGGAAGEREAVWSPDGKSVAFTYVTPSDPHLPADGENVPMSVWIVPADGDEPVFLTAGSSPEWSPDGREVLFIPEWSPDRGDSFFYDWALNKLLPCT